MGILDAKGLNIKKLANVQETVGFQKDRYFFNPEKPCWIFPILFTFDFSKNDEYNVTIFINVNFSF